jgi:succinate dehydrogenase / fumarate reductase flavoprotein subunit
MKRLKQHRYHPPLHKDGWQAGVARVEHWLDRGRRQQGGIAELRLQMQTIMQEHFSVYRTHEVMAEGVQRLEQLAASLPDAGISDGARLFNTELIEAMELENLMSLARVTAAGALARTESRGAHARDDFPERDDHDWLKHTLGSILDGRVKLDYKPVRMQPMTVDAFPPKKRVY